MFDAVTELNNIQTNKPNKEEKPMLIKMMADKAYLVSDISCEDFLFVQRNCPAALKLVDEDHNEVFRLATDTARDAEIRPYCLVFNGEEDGKLAAMFTVTGQNREEKKECAAEMLAPIWKYVETVAKNIETQASVYRDDLKKIKEVVTEI